MMKKSDAPISLQDTGLRCYDEDVPDSCGIEVKSYSWRLLLFSKLEQS